MPRNTDTIHPWWLALALVFALGCSQEKPKAFVARVDQTLLTPDELAAAQDSTGHPQPRREYVNEWVNDELLYQEAKRRGLADDPRLRRLINDASKKMTIAALLDKELYGEENVSEDEIVALYNGGGEALRLNEDVANASFVLFDDRDAANTFRGSLLRGTPWAAACDGIRADSSLGSHVLQIATRQYFTRTNLYPPELWKLASTLGKDEVSFVVKTSTGYYVLVAHSLKKAGEMPELEYIHGELYDRIVIERRRLKYEKFLAQLRSKHVVEIRFTDEDTTLHAKD